MLLQRLQFVAEVTGDKVRRLRSQLVTFSSIILPRPFAASLFGPMPVQHHHGGQRTQGLRRCC